jgi:hypothetical protein
LSPIVTEAPLEERVYFFMILVVLSVLNVTMISTGLDEEADSFLLARELLKKSVQKNIPAFARFPLEDRQKLDAAVAIHSMA